MRYKDFTQLSFLQNIVRPTNKVLNAAGQHLITNPNSQESFDLVNEWRALHAIPLARFRTNIHQYFSKRKTARTIVQRLKRIPTIINKVQRFPNIGLASFQDVGGIRIIVDNITEVYAVRKNLLEKRSDFSFTQTKESDYIDKPKPKQGYGYRSIHLMYKFTSTDEQYNNLRVECQIRTKIQHLWATAVEAIDIIKNQSLKSGMGDEEWHNFFAIVSSLFAVKEGTSVCEEHVGKTKDELVKIFRILKTKLKAIETSKGIIDIPKALKFKKRGTKYCIIVLNSQTKETEVKEFKNFELEQANTEYAEIEKDILTNTLPKIAVLASAQDAKKLKQGYLGYFLDVQEFIVELEDLTNTIPN